MLVDYTSPSTRLLTLKTAVRPKLSTKHDGWFPPLASGLRFIKQLNPLLCRLLTSAQSPHALLHKALPSFDGRNVGQISPGKNMIFPYTTAAFTIPQRSGWASSCCADSPWGSALYAISVRRLIGLHLGFFQTVGRPSALALG